MNNRIDKMAYYQPLFKNHLGEFYYVLQGFLFAHEKILVAVKQYWVGGTGNSTSSDQ